MPRCTNEVCIVHQAGQASRCGVLLDDVEYVAVILHEAEFAGALVALSRIVLKKKYRIAFFDKTRMDRLEREVLKVRL